VKGGKALFLFGIRSAYAYLAAVGLCGSIAFVVGCGDASGNKLVPVVGKVTVDGQPLKAGNGVSSSVSFRPEKGSGNSQEPAGDIDEDSTYRLFTNGKEGAPPGRYHVLVTAMERFDPKSPFPYGKRKSYVNSKYGDLKTSDLVIEVVPSPAPGAYDLKLKK
jgi:hypothetical protein